MADTQSVIKEVETKMTGALDALGREFAAVRTGRASAGLLFQPGLKAGAFNARRGRG